MADTLITNSSPVARDSDSAAGWTVAVLILAAVVLGGIFMWRSGYVGNTAAATPAQGGTNINVTLPNTPNTGGATGNTNPTGGTGSTGGTK